MSTSIRVYLEHILNETRHLIGQSQGLRKDAFLRDDTMKRAFVRSLEIIGEAAARANEDTH